LICIATAGLGEASGGLGDRVRDLGQHDPAPLRAIPDAPAHSARACEPSAGLSHWPLAAQSANGQGLPIFSWAGRITACPWAVWRVWPPIPLQRVGPSLCLWLDAHSDLSHPATTAFRPSARHALAYCHRARRFSTDCPPRLLAATLYPRA